MYMTVFENENVRILSPFLMSLLFSIKSNIIYLLSRSLSNCRFRVCSILFLNALLS